MDGSGMLELYEACEGKMEKLEIIYRDQNYIAVNKPSGLFVHRSEFDRRADFAMRMVRRQAGCRVYPVHRLDRPTSGALLFALNREAASVMGGIFREKRVEKTYLAVVRGYTERAGRIDYALKSERGAEAKDAVTFYERVATAELPIPVGRYATARYSLVKIRPETGRLHQIRKHFAHIFHHVAGDTVHGDGRHNRLFREHFGIRRLLLAATRLEFADPLSGKEISIRAEIDGEMKRLFGELGFCCDVNAHHL